MKMKRTQTQTLDFWKLYVYWNVTSRSLILSKANQIKNYEFFILFYSL